jgi:16S rRNA C967 or C1407 C5-methylase (RsmB/RsmF family)/NOL1/NOP2/fmu family ribosome biogenesis protein
MPKDRRTKDPGPVPFFLPPHVERLLGPEASHLLEALQRPAPVSLRRNPWKPAEDLGTPVPWCTEGRYLADRPVFTLDPLFHAGAYYVQEAASMLLEQAVKACGPWPERPVVLDLCASPGGKATHLAALIPKDALLVANEAVRERQPVLQENLWKWGRHDTVITGSGPGAFAPLGSWCHLVLVDAPCSGEGMFRKDPFSRKQWSDGLVSACALRQRGIVAAAWEALLPGGHLVYSTCTWETDENENVLKTLLDQGAIQVTLPVEPAWGTVAGSIGRRCYPHRLQGEGFFIAVLRKPGEDRTIGATPGESAACAIPAHWLVEPQGITTLESGGIHHLISRHWARLVRELMDTVRVLAPGIPSGRPKGNRLMPHHALALQQGLRTEAFNTVPLDRDGALRYLRGEALPAQAAQGIGLVCHQGLPMGWVNGAGNRWNNAWPASWRIRMGR